MGSIARGTVFTVLTTLAFPSISMDLIASAPTFKTGDRWEFEGIENGKPYVFSREVLDLLPDGRMRVRAIRNGKEAEEMYDGAMNALVGGRVDRVRELAKYPMAPNARWTFRMDYENPNVTSDGQGKVVGVERITVPAGTFECFKVEAAATFGVGRSYTAFERITRWHCPDIKWIAKESYSRTTQSSYNPAENSIRVVETDLVRFTPGR
jgi:hypothetical protein